MHSLLAAILRALDGDLVHHADCGGALRRRAAARCGALRRVGDPRDELIALDLARAGSIGMAELQARRAELRATYGPVWWT